MSFLDKIDKRIADLQAVRDIYVREMLDDSSDAEEAGATPRLGDTGVINVDDLGLPTKPVSKKNTLQITVKNVISRFDKKEFTVNHVFAALDQMGKVATNRKNYKNRVSMIIRLLTSEGALERTYEGSGNAPHKYRETEKQSEVS